MSGSVEYKQYLKDDPTDWLLEPENPSVRYFAMRDLLDMPDDSPELVKQKSTIMDSPAIKEFFKDQTQDGYWGHPDRWRSEVKFYGTAWRLIYMPHLGVDPEEDRVEKTVAEPTRSTSTVRAWVNFGTRWWTRSSH